MSRSGEIYLQFGDEVRRFRLGVAEWQRVQEAVDFGPAEVVAHLAVGPQAQRQVLELFPSLAHLLGRFRAREARSVLFHGLLGGGMEANAAGRLMTDLVDGRPLLEPIPTAFAAAMAAIVGIEDEPVGEPVGEAAETPAGRASPEERSGSPSSTRPRSVRGSAPTKSTAGRSGRSPRSMTSSPAKPRPKAASPSRPAPKS